MIIIFLCLITCFWLYVETSMIKKTYTNSKDVSKKAKQNNLWLAIATIFCFVTLYHSVFVHWHLRELSFLYWIGTLFAMGGILLRKRAIITLQHHFDSLIQVKKDQQLIQHGVYRYVRHPSYTGTILTFLGFGIMSMNFWYVLLFPSLFFICYHIRIQLEEKVLLDGFGAEYERYREQTWRLFPWFKLRKKNIKESL